jgi:hypothetical protein
MAISLMIKEIFSKIAPGMQREVKCWLLWDLQALEKQP